MKLALAQLLGHLLGTLGTAASIVGWVALAHYWLGISTETALLSFIAFATCGVTATVFMQTQRVLEPQLPPKRDFYVVTNESYRWNLPESVVRPNKAKPELGGTIYAYDNLAAAEMKYRQLDAEHSLLDLEDRDFSYHKTFGYDEEETRLWVVYAHSKTEAHDKVFYDDTRRYLGHDGRTDDILLGTNNEPRRQHYLDWWRPLYQAALSAEREEIEAKMTYDAAIALFGFKELPLPPDSIRCEVVEKLYAELRAKSKELEAAATSDGKAQTARNIDWKARTAISVADALISKRISDARACGKDGPPCTIHVRDVLKEADRCLNPDLRNRDAVKPDNLKSDFSPSVLLRAWGKALIKTGTEHLDLAMVRQGKQTLKNVAETKTPPTSSDA